MTMRSGLRSSAPLLFLLACTNAAPHAYAGKTAAAPEPIDEWKREALAERQEMAGHRHNEFDTYSARIADLLDNPDPPAVVGPEVKILPAGDAVVWPAFTLRYRSERRACPANFGCDLVALCPVDTPPGTAPAAELAGFNYLPARAPEGISVAELDVPSPKCSVRLYLRDSRRGNTVCTARGPKLPAPGNGTSIVDVGTLGLDGVRCDEDKLAARMMFRAELLHRWRWDYQGKVGFEELLKRWAQKARAEPKVDSYSGKVTDDGKLVDVVDNPDPPAVVGPEVKLLPADDAVVWPALTLRYRIERKDCRTAGSDMGCHLVALCPVETPPGTAPAATRVDSAYVGEQTFAGITVEKLHVPSPKCELRLYARDHHGSVICTARGPKLPAPGNGPSIVDLGTIGLDGVPCEEDKLAERMVMRAQLIDLWRSRNAKKP